MNLEKIGAFLDQADKLNQIEVNFKKYISDIEPSIKYLQKLQEISKDL